MEQYVCLAALRAISPAPSSTYSERNFTGGSIVKMPFLNVLIPERKQNVLCHYTDLHWIYNPVAYNVAPSTTECTTVVPSAPK